MRFLRFLSISAILPVLAVAHDDLTGSTGGSNKLAFILPNLFGTGGLTLPNPEHVAHFDSAFRESFTPFNSAIASQLTSLPLPSPASGFVYTIDPALGVATKSSVSFGPILAERAETIGKDKFFFGFSSQFFRFDSLDGINLRKVPAVFQHSPTENVNYQRDLITADTLLDMRIGQFTSYFTYGLTDRLDVSVALPLVSANLDVISTASIRRIGTGADNTVHFFNTGDKTTEQFSGAGHATGLGDVLIRTKGTVYRSAKAGLALGLDLRAPTGDEYDFLGSGAPGVRPFLAASFRAGRLSPHFNGSFQWNGSSVLAGDVTTGRKEKLSNEIGYVAGADIGVTQKFTLAMDLLGVSRTNGKYATLTNFTAANNQNFQNIAFRNGARNITNGSVGFKVNGVANLLVTFNLLFKLNDDGLRGRVAPLIGLAYSF
ncbi:MAG: hypothetical protein JST93_36860 [Acidobacteria bacterium]|nr:hypothetical protein [Acidobacteriota bacterium]